MPAAGGNRQAGQQGRVAEEWAAPLGERATQGSGSQAGGPGENKAVFEFALHYLLQFFEFPLTKGERGRSYTSI